MTTSKPFSPEFDSKNENEKNPITLLRPRPEVVEEFFASFGDEKRKCLVEFKHKYNFDFVNEVPLPEGRYEWYPVDSSNEDGDHDSETPETKATGAS